MDSNLGWKTAELQIEAIVPGILSLSEITLMAEGLPSLDPLSDSSGFLLGCAFTAAGYSLGVILTYVSRIIVDSLSESGPRALVFNRFAHAKLDPLVMECETNDDKFAPDLAAERDRILRISENSRRWNAAYRSALRRTSRENDVDRRRSQGRVLRNLFVPATLLPFILIGTPWIRVVGIIGCTLGIVFLYSYAEYVNFAEAYDIGRSKPR